MQLLRTITATAFRAALAAVNATCLAAPGARVGDATLDKASGVLFGALSGSASREEILHWLESVGHLRQPNPSHHGENPSPNPAPEDHGEADLGMVYASCVALTVHVLRDLRVDDVQKKLDKLLQRSGSPHATPKSRQHVPKPPRSTAPSSRRGRSLRAPTPRDKDEKADGGGASTDGRWHWVCAALPGEAEPYNRHGFGNDADLPEASVLVGAPGMRLTDLVEPADLDRSKGSKARVAVGGDDALEEEPYYVAKLVHERTLLCFFATAAAMDLRGGAKMRLGDGSVRRVARLFQPLAWGCQGAPKRANAVPAWNCWVDFTTSSANWDGLVAAKYTEKAVVYRFSFFLLALLGDVLRATVSRIYSFIRSTSSGGDMDEARLYELLGPTVTLLSRSTLSRVVIWYQQNSRGALGGHSAEILEIVGPVLSELWAALPYLHVAPQRFIHVGRHGERYHRPYQGPDPNPNGKPKPYDQQNLSSNPKPKNDCGGLEELDIFPGWYTPRDAQHALGRRPGHMAPVVHAGRIIECFFDDGRNNEFLDPWH
mmetsp:Transcript_28128/g.89929  ORF Transcript_28128/g.89929 Transcript_28128/m.89929 type:complete len:543 (-) Transcript_28128:202-1830(-)